MNTDVMFSSKTPEWETPLDFFRTLDAEFHIKDVAEMLTEVYRETKPQEAGKGEAK